MMNDDDYAPAEDAHLEQAYEDRFGVNDNDGPDLDEAYVYDPDDEDGWAFESDPPDADLVQYRYETALMRRVYGQDR